MSIELGKFNQLEVVKEVDFGMYLDGGEEGEILLPARYVPENCRVGDILNVFLYLDMDERLIATTLTPLVQVGQFACLEVDERLVCSFQGAEDEDAGRTEVCDSCAFG